MQRQSLGSPLSKLVKDELPSHSSSFASTPLSYGEECHKEVEQLKKLKPKPTPPPQSYIHLIPILTLLCFLVLYLSSHDPSLKESIENISELQGILEIEKGAILAIRSLKNLKQEADAAAKHRRLHRKIPHF